MTQEDKELLFIDLCARLPYGVKVCIVEDLAMTLKQIDYKGFCESWENEYFKCRSRWTLLYLRPMSSMTEEEKLDYTSIDNRAYCCPQDFAHIPATDRIDWLNVHHFDYHGLIEKGLALEAPEGMYNIKEK